MKKPARDRLISEHLESARLLVINYMRRFNIPAMFKDELIAAANLGLVEAASRYDKNQGDFYAFAIIRIRGAVIDAMRNRSDLSSAAYRHARSLEALTLPREELQRNLRRSKSKQERLKKILKYVSRGVLSTRIDLSCETELEYGASSFPIPHEYVEKLSERKLFLKVIGELPKLERKIIEQYYFKDRSFQEILAKNRKISKSWLSRLHTKALDRIRGRLIELNAC